VPLTARPGDRLTLREPESADAEALRDYYRRNAVRFSPWEPARSEALTEHREWIAARRSERRGDAATAFLAFDASGGGLAGVVTLSGFGEQPRGASIDYTIDGAFEGRGYAYEAVTRVAGYAFETLGLEILTAYRHPENARSARLLERAGFSVVARTPVIPGLEHLMRPQVIAARRRPV
jgi:RimJ/RimL family protein N-acetyltransferase